ncbi:MAG: hypothetical protein ACKOBN_03180 [Flavobacteriales bacterium]
MNQLKQYLLKPWFVFVLSFLIIAMLLIFISPNLFEGEIVYEKGGKEYILQAPLSLAYFLGMGYQSSEMTDVVDFYLTKRGYMLAFSLLFGFPILFAYRSLLEKRDREKR